MSNVEKPSSGRGSGRRLRGHIDSTPGTSITTSTITSDTSRAAVLSRDPDSYHTDADRRATPRYSPPPPTQNRRGDGAVQRSTGASAIRARRLPLGTFSAGASIFLGWHRQQLSKAGNAITSQQDYRQCVFATISATGHIHNRLRTSNIAGEPIPTEYRLKGVSAVPHSHIVYHSAAFCKLTYDEIRGEIARQSRLPIASGQGWPSITVLGESSSGESPKASAISQKRSRGRPPGSKNKQTAG